MRGQTIGALPSCRSAAKPALTQSSLRTGFVSVRSKTASAGAAVVSRATLALDQMQVATAALQTREHGGRGLQPRTIGISVGQHLQQIRRRLPLARGLHHGQHLAHEPLACARAAVQPAMSVGTQELGHSMTRTVGFESERRESVVHREATPERGAKA
jgi:hypothetical protein